MGATKFEIHSEEINQAAELFKALSNPARLKAFLIIAESIDEDADFCKIHNQIALSQSTMSSHMKILKDVGLIKTKNVFVGKNSNKVIYRINYPVVSQLNEVIKHIISRSEFKEDPTFNTFSNFHCKLEHVLNINRIYSA